MELFHVEQFHVRIIHHFQASAIFEGDESAGELFCGIVIKRVNISTEVLSVEITDLVDIFYPDGDMLYFHNKPTIIYIKRWGTKTEFSTSIHIGMIIIIL